MKKKIYIVFGLLLLFPTCVFAGFKTNVLTVTDKIKADTYQSQTGTDTVTLPQLSDAVSKKHTQGHYLGSPADHTDVDTTGITDGQGLKWEAATKKWLPGLSPFMTDVASFATGGNGSEATPWTGWDTAITWSGMRTYYFRAGCFEFTSTITIAENETYLIGAGKGPTRLIFSPTTAGTAIKFRHATASIDNCGISGMVIYSADTTYKKIALELVDARTFCMSDIWIGPSGWTGATSVGIQFQGRDQISVQQVVINADICIEIKKCPAVSVALDHAHFQDLYLMGVDLTNPLISVTGTDTSTLQNITFDGYQPWARGGFGFQWIDTTSAEVSMSLTFKNVRWEQGTNASGYAIQIENNYTLQKLLIENLHVGSGVKGIKLRNVDGATLSRFAYDDNALTALDVDTSVRILKIENSFSQLGSTVSLGGLKLIYGASSSLSVLYPDALYMNPAYVVYAGTSVDTTIGTSDISVDTTVFQNMDEMTYTATFTAGNIFAIFNASFSATTASDVVFGIYIDGVCPREASMRIETNSTVTTSTCISTYVGAGSHTISVKWKKGAAAIQQNSTGAYKRYLTIIRGLN